MLKVVLERSDSGGWLATIPPEDEVHFSERDLRLINQSLVFSYRKWKFDRKLRMTQRAMKAALENQATQRKEGREQCLTKSTTGSKTPDQVPMQASMEKARVAVENSKLNSMHKPPLHKG